MAGPNATISPARKLLYAALTTAVVLAGVEIAVRAATTTLGHATLPDEDVRAHVQSEGLNYDPVYGWVRSQLPDRRGHVDIHQFRRNPAVDTEKPADGWRAFTFGDSQTYGAGLKADQAYPAVAEDALAAAHPDHTVEVVNAALSGYGSLQALRLMRYKVPDFSPDLYIVDAIPQDQPRDEIVPPVSGAAAFERVLFSWRTYYVLRFAIERARGRLRPMIPEARRGNVEYAGNHDSIMALAAQQGVPVVFLDYPFWNMHNRGDDDPISCMATQELLPPGAQLIGICQALKATGRPAGELFLDNNHMSADGAAIAGQALAEGIEALGVGPSG